LLLFGPDLTMFCGCWHADPVLVRLMLMVLHVNSQETHLHWFCASNMNLDTEFELIGILIGEQQGLYFSCSHCCGSLNLSTFSCSTLSSLMFTWRGEVVCQQHPQ